MIHKKKKKEIKSKTIWRKFKFICQIFSWCGKKVIVKRTITLWCRYNFVSSQFSSYNLRTKEVNEKTQRLKRKWFMSFESFSRAFFSDLRYFYMTFLGWIYIFSLFSSSDHIKHSRSDYNVQANYQKDMWIN